jgi:predicted MFS family arabinose efflux permease
MRAIDVHISESSPRFFGWRVLIAAFIGMTFSPGPIIAVLLGAIAAQLSAEFNIDRGQVMFSLTVFSFATIVSVCLVGRLIDKLGARRVLIVSASLVVLNLVALAYVANTIAAFYCLVGLFGFVSTGAQSITYNKLLAAWFDQKRGLAIGISTAGAGMGYAILPLVMAQALAVTTWRGSIVVVAALTLLPLILAVGLAVPPPTIGERGDTKRLPGVPITVALRDPKLWAIAVAIFCITASALGLVPNLVGFSHDQGIRTTTLSFIFGIATLGGRFAFGYLFDRFFAPWVAASCFVISASGFGALAFAAANMGGRSSDIAAVAVVGFGLAAEGDLIGYLTSRYFGLLAFGQIYGFLYIIFLLGIALGPYAFGVGRDLFGTYTAVFAAAGVSALIAGVLMFSLPSYPAAFPESIKEV